MTELANVTPAAPPATPKEPAASTMMTVDAARTRRAEILADKAAGKRLMEGDAALRAEWDGINKTIAGTDLGTLVKSAVDGNVNGPSVTTDGVMAPREYASAHAHLAPALGNQAFLDVVLGTPQTQERHDEAVQIKRIVMSDRDWIRAYRTRSEAHMQQMTRINAVLVAPIIGK
jgi:hypothetical protein